MTTQTQTAPIAEQLRKAIAAYTGPLPACGNSTEEVWLRGAFQQLLYLERQGVRS